MKPLATSQTHVNKALHANGGETARRLLGGVMRCVCSPRREREAGTRVGMGQIWNVADKLAALRTLLSGQIFCITAVCGGGGSFLVRVAPAELEMFFLAGTANGII